MVFYPSLDFGESGTVGAQTGQDEGEEGVEGMRLSAFGAGIRNFFETWDEESEGRGSGRGQKNLREGKEWAVRSDYVKKVGV